MYDHILYCIQALVAQRRYIIPTHAAEEMAYDDLDVFDVEAAIMSGDITERQRDWASGEWKYIITGAAVDGRPLDVVAKLLPNDVLIITVYLL